MVKRKISLDCDGVISDVNGFLRDCFYDYFKREMPDDFIDAYYSNKIEKCTERDNFDHEKIKQFLEKYPSMLFKALPELKVVNGAKDGIERLTKKGIGCVVNSYRPSECQGIKQNIGEITRDWFKKNELYLPVNLFESEDEKCSGICNSGFETHVDDNPGLLRNLKSSNNNLALIFYNPECNLKINEKIITVKSWAELTEFILNFKN
ncbi:hypothetical protein A3K73_02425 [Candidatus Pacearchaeota archaeon RBG_13_36_9]|nr:MAG: hypothetical protein A3K73_02425 [Candidatus Pacearchaeota archaeon RBG_13_36_9]